MINTNFLLILIILFPLHSHATNLISIHKKQFKESDAKIRSKQIKAKPSTSAQFQQFSKSHKYKYVYLRSNKVNLRAGPSTKYPINWVIHNKGEPLKSLRSFYQWIKVKDIKGHQGWLQAPMITTRRMYGVIINKNKKPVIAYAMANSTSRKIVKLELGVRVRVLKCINKTWCKIRINQYQAWILKKNLWGINT